MDVRNVPSELTVERTETAACAIQHYEPALVADPDTLWERPMVELLRAFSLLSRRGTGELAWVTSFNHSPIAFLLDAVSDATNVWDADGVLLYQNRASLELGLGTNTCWPDHDFFAGGKHFGRRCVECHAQGNYYVLEIIHEIVEHS